MHEMFPTVLTPIAESAHLWANQDRVVNLVSWASWAIWASWADDLSRISYLWWADELSLAQDFSDQVQLSSAKFFIGQAQLNENNSNLQLRIKMITYWLFVNYARLWANQEGYLLVLCPFERMLMYTPIKFEMTAKIIQEFYLAKAD